MNLYHLVGTRLGQYELREMLGRGGMGVVYQALQLNLNRTVAIKILTAALASDQEYVARFVREAQTAAALEHPHIVPVHDYGTENDIIYVAMRFLTGGTLKERLKLRENNPDPLPTLAEVDTLVQKIGSALDYAHAHGIVHRDIKASNIMFDSHGNPFVVDFGIAKIIASVSTNLTDTGHALGTPTHMAPEQWDGQGISGATDQYAFGVLLYQVLTGQLPFTNTAPSELMFKHLHETPLAPHMRRPNVPEAVSAVVLRMLAKSPQDRFPSLAAMSQAFSDAIAGISTDRTTFFTFALQDSAPLVVEAPVFPKAVTPLSAMNASPAPQVSFTHNRLSTFLYRYRTTPLLWMMTFVIAVLLLGLIYVLATSTVEPNPNAQVEASVEARVYATLTAQGLQTQIQRGVDATLQAQTLTLATGVFPTNTPPTQTHTPTVTFEVITFEPLILPTVTGDLPILEALTETPSPDPPTLTPSPTPTVTATTTLTPTMASPTSADTPEPLILVPIRLDNANAMREVLQYTAPNADQVLTRPINSVAFSPTQPLIAFGGADNLVYLWDYTQQTPPMILRGHEDEVRSVAFSPNGLTLASGSWDDTVRLWDVATGYVRQVLQGHDGWIYSVAFDPLGEIVLSGSSDFTARLWDVFTGNARFVLDADTDRVTSVAFNATGDVVAIGTQSGTIDLWRLGQQALPQTATVMRHDQWVEALAFSPRRTELLASGSRDTRVRLWNVDTGEEIGVLNHPQWVYSVAFSPNGDILAVANGTEIWLWDVIQQAWLATLSGHADWVTSVAFNADGTLLVSASGDGTVRLWGITP